MAPVRQSVLIMGALCLSSSCHAWGESSRHLRGMLAQDDKGVSGPTDNADLVSVDASAFRAMSEDAEADKVEEADKGSRRDSSSTPEVTGKAPSATRPPRPAREDASSTPTSATDSSSSGRTKPGRAGRDPTPPPVDEEDNVGRVPRPGRSGEGSTRGGDAGGSDAAGGKGKPADNTPSDDSMDSQRYTGQVALPDGHVVKIDVPSPADRHSHRRRL